MSGAGAPMDGAGPVESRAQGLEQPDEVGAVLRARADPRFAVFRIFPVHVEPVRVLGGQQLRGAIRECLAAGGTACRFRESAGAPAAHRNHYFECRVRRPQRN